MFSMNQAIRRLLSSVPFAQQLNQELRWRGRERRFRRFLAAIPAAPSAASGEVVAVVVQPWLLSDIPWYSVLLAHGLARRDRNVVIVWDDLPWRGNADEALVNGSIGRVLEDLPASWRVERLTSATQGGTVLDEASLARLADLNTTWLYRGHDWPADAIAERDRSARHFVRVAAAIEDVLRRLRATAIVLPGGVFASSGVMRSVAERLGIRVATYDSGEGILLTSCNGVAAWLSDIPRAFTQLDPRDDDWIAELAECELQGRRGASNGSSVFGGIFQAAPADASTGGADVLIPLNLSFDTAALGRHRVFQNQIELMLETVRWVLARPTGTVLIRRHPVERLPGLRSRDEYGDILRREFGDTPRLRYVDETEKVSTYALLSGARVVVPYTSTVGVEATMLGVPVVTESASYYADMGFVWSARTRDEYFSFLERALGGELRVDEERRRASRRVYYLTQLCNFVFTDVAPMPGDFEKWVRRSPAEVLATPEFTDVIEALATDVPLAVLRHRRRERARLGAA